MASKNRILPALIAVFMASCCAAARADLISVQMVTVGDPGNAPDSTGYGAVGYAYQIGKYDVTVSQYAAFLNAVAQTDTYGLYNTHLASNFATFGISRTGSPGSYTYAVTGTAAGRSSMPVSGVNWGDAARFCNWLQNGQVAGPEGNGTTETGAYTLKGATSDAALMAITRNPGATSFLPTADEWYKAACYKGGGTSAGYWLYPTRTNSVPSNGLSATGTNNANYNDFQRYGQGLNDYTDPVNFLTPVGAFAASPGPYGTFDQGGDVWQWTEETAPGISRLLRGGSYFLPSGALSSADYMDTDPGDENRQFGFRVAGVADVPEPASIAMLLAGASALAIWGLRRRAVRAA